MLILQYFIGLALFVLASIIIAAAFKVAFGNKAALRAARSSSISLKDAITGDLKPLHDGRRDFRVAAGIALKTENGKKKWIPQGKLSDEALQTI